MKSHGLSMEGILVLENITAFPVYSSVYTGRIAYLISDGFLYYGNAITNRWEKIINLTLYNTLVTDLSDHITDLNNPHETGDAIIGEVRSVAYETADVGWLECDGSSISRTTYSDLFAKLGEKWGQGDGSTTFKIPDLRGKFVRGWDHGGGVDPERNDRTSSASGGDTGNSVGSIQGDEFEEHDHAIFGEGNNKTYGEVSGNYSLSHLKSDESGLSGGEETRPKNVYLMYQIKY